MIPNRELELFVNSLEQYDWFCDAELGQFNKFIVYVDKFDMKTISLIPLHIGGYHVVFHYIASQPSKNIITPPETKVLSISDLIIELSYLKDICGAKSLESIFYEVHDQDNAVTSVSEFYPEVKKAMDRLYQDFGFDLIYEQLDV